MSCFLLPCHNLPGSAQFYVYLLGSRPLGRISQPLYYWHFSRSHSILGEANCPVDCRMHPCLLPTRYLWDLFLIPSCDNQKMSLDISNCPCGMAKITLIENHCSKGKKYPQVGAGLDKAKWSLSTVAIGMEKGVGWECKTKTNLKKGRMLRKSWLQQTLQPAPKGTANIGQASPCLDM